MKILFLSLLSAVLFFQNGVAQVPRRVDISFLGDFRLFTQNIDGSIRKDKPTFQLAGFETYITGYLNPFGRGTFMIATHGHEFEVEEGYADINRLLPWGLSVKAGKYQVNFGRIALMHPHALPFMEYPIIERIYGGFHAYNDMGIQLNWMLPIETYANLSINVLHGDWLAHAQSGHIESEDIYGEYRGTSDPVFTSRFNIFTGLSERTNLDLGLSGLYGIYRGKDLVSSGGRDLHATMGCLDFKYKWRPNDYTALEIVGEGVVNHRQMPDNNPIDNWGMVTYANLKFRRNYNIGIKFDYAPGIFDYEGSFDWDYGPEYEYNNTRAGQFDDKNHTWAISAFGGFSLMEETTLIRFLVKYQDYIINDASSLNNTALTDKKAELLYATQLVFSLGPHKPHDF